MTTPSKADQPPVASPAKNVSKQSIKKKRLANALRENLLRRKAVIKNTEQQDDDCCS